MSKLVTLKLTKEQIKLELESLIHIVDNRFIWGYRHLFSSIWHALKAEKGDKMISKTLSIEILLYTSGNRQIKKAIELSGVNDRTEEIAGILIGNTKELSVVSNVMDVISVVVVMTYSWLIEGANALLPACT